MTGSSDTGPDSVAAESGRTTGVPLGPAVVSRVDALAASLAEKLTAADPRGARFRQTVAAIGQLGERSFIASAAVSGRVLERGLATMHADLRPGSPLAKRLEELRREAARLDPARPGHGRRNDPEAETRRLEEYLERFARARPKLDDTIAEMGAARYALESDAAAVEAEIAALAAEIGSLEEFALLAERIDALLTARLEESAAADRRAGAEGPAAAAAGGPAAAPEAAPAAAAAIAEAAFAARRRRAEILTQLAVSMQGLAALRIVEASNRDVIDALDAAIETTATALRTAVLVAQAVAGRRVALGRVEAARRAATGRERGHPGGERGVGRGQRRGVACRVGAGAGYPGAGRGAPRQGPRGDHDRGPRDRIRRQRPLRPRGPDCRGSRFGSTAQGCPARACRVL